MTDPAPLWLILNQTSGSNDDDANARLIATLGQAGSAPARTIDCASERLPDRAALEAAGVGIVACHTGDGTAGALITALEGWRGAILVLPGGTTNLLAKALHGDRPAADVAADLMKLCRVRRPCIRFAGGTAVIEVLAGPGAKWSDVREGLRDGDLAEVAGKTIEAARASAGGSMVILADPDIGKPDGYAGLRLTPHDRGIRVDGYGAETVGDYLLQGWALLRRNFREGPHDELGLQPLVHCTASDAAPIELMIDGERRTGAAQMRFSLAELDVDLLSGAQ